MDAYTAFESPTIMGGIAGTSYTMEHRLPVRSDAGNGSCVRHGATVMRRSSPQPKAMPFTVAFSKPTPSASAPSKRATVRRGKSPSGFCRDRNSPTTRTPTLSPSVCNHAATCASGAVAWSFRCETWTARFTRFNSLTRRVKKSFSPADVLPVVSSRCRIPAPTH